MHRQLSRTQLLLAAAVSTLLAALPTDAWAVADVQYDTLPCSAVFISELPQDGAMLPAMPAHGIVLAFHQDGGTPEQIEAAVTLTVVDAMGAMVAGRWEYVESPSHIVWRPEQPLTLGAVYSVQLTLDAQVLDPEGCSFRDADMLHYGYGVEIVDAPMALAPPSVGLEVSYQTYAGDTSCCLDAPRTCDPADFARRVNLRAELDSGLGADALAWTVRELRFYAEGDEAAAVATPVGISTRREVIAYGWLDDWDGASQLCVTVDHVDAIDGTVTEGTTTCLGAGSVGDPGPLEDAVCGPVPSDTSADMTMGADGANGAMPGAPGDTDCACAVRADAGAPSPTPWLAAVALFLAGAVLRWRRT